MNKKNKNNERSKSLTGPTKQSLPDVGVSLSAQTGGALANPGKVLISAAAFVVVIAGMQAAVNIIIPFLLAVFLAIISTPALFWMKKRRISTFFAILIISLVILAAGLLVGALLATSIADFTKTLPEYAKKLEENFNLLLSWLESKGVQVEKPLMDYLRPDAAAAVKMMRELLAQLGTLLKNSFLIYLTMVFILLEASALPSKIRQALDSKETFDNLAHIADNVKRYLALKTALSLATGLLVMGLLIVLNVSYPVVWGLIAFLLNFVPNIGSIIAAVPAVILALLQHGPGTAVLALLGFLVINVSIGNFLEPRLMGQRLGLSTLVVFLSLIFWGWVLGPMGMLLSVPLTMTVKIALQTNKETRWMAMMLGSYTPPASEEDSHAAT